jgi:hypothetical protein
MLYALQRGDQIAYYDMITYSFKSNHGQRECRLGLETALETDYYYMLLALTCLRLRKKASHGDPCKYINMSR